jgi:hypothetical protein
MKTVNQMVTLVKEASSLSKDKEIEDLLGIRPMGLASLKKENRVGSFLKFLVPFCENKNISINEFLLDERKLDAFINTPEPEETEETEDMLNRELLFAQRKIISLLEENSLLKDQLLMGKQKPSAKKKIS